MNRRWRILKRGQSFLFLCVSLCVFLFSAWCCDPSLLAVPGCCLCVHSCVSVTLELLGVIAKRLYRTQPVNKHSRGGPVPVPAPAAITARAGAALFIRRRRPAQKSLGDSWGAHHGEGEPGDPGRGTR